MIATRHIVFLHLHKSGGTFVNEGLLRFIPDARHIGYHLPRSMIPPPLQSLPVVGLVRNPWSYYVSWYAFQSKMPRPNALFRVLSDGGRLDFENTVQNMLNLCDGGERLTALVQALPEAYTNRGINIPGFVAAAIQGTELGFYSYLYRYLYDGDGVLHLGRMEWMRDELARILSSAGEPVGEGLRSYLEDAPASNTSEHGDYSSYYSESLRELVARRDGVLIDRFGYRFGR